MKLMTDKIICPNCVAEIEINPAAMLGRRKKTMTPAAIKARRENAKKGGRPRKKGSTGKG